MSDEPKPGVYFDGVIQGLTPQPHGVLTNVLPKHSRIEEDQREKRRYRHSCSCGSDWEFFVTYEAKIYVRDQAVITVAVDRAFDEHVHSSDSEVAAVRRPALMHTYVYATFTAAGHLITERIDFGLNADALNGMLEVLHEIHGHINVRPEEVCLAMPMEVSALIRADKQYQDRVHFLGVENEDYDRLANVLGVKSVHLADYFRMSL